MTRALYATFRPSPIGPRVTAVSEQTIGSIISSPLPDKELRKGSKASEDLAADFLMGLAAKNGREAIKKA